MKGKKNMTNVSDRKIFYTLVLKDRLPISSIRFPLDSGACRIDFYSTPIGLIFKAWLGENYTIKDFKLYDKKRAGFERHKKLLCDELVRLDDGSLASITHKLQIEDTIGRDFLIRIDNNTVIAKAQMIFKPNIDKCAKVVYN